MTTPTAKLRPKILAQNLAARLYFSSLVLRARHFHINQEPGQPHGELRKKVVVIAANASKGLEFYDLRFC